MGSNKNKEGFKYLMLFASRRKGGYLVSVLLAVLSVFAAILPYFVISKIVVMLLDSQALYKISDYIRYFIIIGISLILKEIFHALSTSISHKVTFQVISDIRREIADKLVKVPMGYALGIPEGTLKTTMIERTNSTEPVLAHAVPEMTSKLLIPICIIVYIFAINPIMGFASLLSLVIGYFGMMGMMKNYGTKFKQMMDISKHMNNIVMEYIEGIKVIKTFSHSASSYEKYQDTVNQNAQFSLDWMKSVNIYFAIALGIMPATLVGVLPIGCLLYMGELLSLTDFIMTIMLSLGIFAPLMAAMNFTDQLAMVNTIMEDIKNIMSEPVMKRTPDNDISNANDIEFMKVSFSYEDDEVLKDISVKFKEGEVTALVGPSGSGKSTIARLAAGFWDSDSGIITIGGIDTKKIPLKILNKKIAYVTQDNFLFNESIMDNIRKGKLDASDDEIIACAKASGCHDFIASLPNGYDEIAGGGGGHLSGGERQRIAIARAMLKDADIILLDEATAYTDPESEAVVQRAISRLAEGKTLVVIAHRLTTIVECDKIYVVNKGKIEDKGTFDELMDHNGLFKTMFDTYSSAKDEIQVFEEVAL